MNVYKVKTQTGYGTNSDWWLVRAKNLVTAAARGEKTNALKNRENEIDRELIAVELLGTEE